MIEEYKLHNPTWFKIKTIQLKRKVVHCIEQGLLLCWNIIFPKDEKLEINEIKDEFQCQRVKPDSSLQVNGLVKHAAEVYTLTLFNIFENEFLKSISST
ncbi:hypothetical protein ACS0TY_013925 [Phlomoides rotata]